MEDSKIIELYWNRSENAIRETEAAYGSYCKTIARNVLENNADAEECVNDAYMTLWNTIPPQRPDRLQSYLGRIVRNGAINRRKARSTAKRGGNRYPAALEELAEVLAAKDGVEEAFEAKELGRQITRFLEELPKEKRVIFLMRYWYCDSVEAIAKATGFTKSKVKMSLLRTRKELKEYLLKEGIVV
jgi:RNA polymerase sigma-70 factor (ECF subfamily)